MTMLPNITMLLNITILRNITMLPNITMFPTITILPIKCLLMSPNVTVLPECTHVTQYYHVLPCLTMSPKMPLLCHLMLPCVPMSLPYYPDQPFVGRHEDWPDQQGGKALWRAGARRCVLVAEPHYAPSALPLHTGDSVVTVILVWWVGGWRSEVVDEGVGAWTGRLVFVAFRVGGCIDGWMSCQVDGWQEIYILVYIYL